MLMVKIMTNPIKNSYPNGECPDCGEEIPNNVVDGENCSNCEHVFCNQIEDDDVRNYQKRNR